MIFNKNNQNDILDTLVSEYSFANKPINRFITKPKVEKKLEKLNILRKKTQDIENCKLKNNSKNIVFSDGDISSPLMIVGEGPGQTEDDQGKPFVGEAGKLLNKMLNAIKIERSKVYITNVVNYRPPKNRKPEPDEILRYSEFLKEHISIFDPKILILMGSTAMEALFGNKIKITKSRGEWKEIVIKNKVFKTIVTFHPAYLLRQPDQKKFSWQDLKKISKEIDNLNIKI